MWLMIILNVTKNQGLDLSLEDKFTEKPQKGSNWPPAFLGLSIFILHAYTWETDECVWINII